MAPAIGPKRKQQIRERFQIRSQFTNALAKKAGFKSIDDYLQHLGEDDGGEEGRQKSPR